MINYVLLGFIANTCIVHSTITGQLQSHGNSIEQALRSDGEERASTGSHLPRQESVSPQRNVSSNRFNLLWIILSRMYHESQFIQDTSIRYRSRNSRKHFRHGVSLHSKLPARQLRYHRKSKLFNTTKRKVQGRHIGFETQFRLISSSGSGYLITGREIGSRQNMQNLPEQLRSTSSPSTASSWFGLYANVKNETFYLKLEFRDKNWLKRQKFSTILHRPGFNVEDWHNLTVQIDYNRDTIDYWVNCSRMNGIRINNPRRYYSRRSFDLFRLLQQKRIRSKVPVKVLIKSMVVCERKVRHQPDQCSNAPRNTFARNCANGHVFMECGPSCRKTCDVKSFKHCAASCVRGCHCPPHKVYSKGSCIDRKKCPCRIGNDYYQVGRRVPVSNSVCTCFSGRWSCYEAASLVSGPQNQTVEAGSNLTLTCEVSGNPLPRIQWETPQNVEARIEKCSRGRRSHLIISNIRTNWTGQYTCFAYRKMGNWSENVTAHVTVTLPPVVSTSPSNALTVMDGTPVANIDCKIKGIPTPSATWIKRGSGKILDVRITASGVLRLTIKRVNTSHAGEYICFAMNKAGVSQKSVKVLVKKSAPISLLFRRRPRDRCVRIGCSVNFPCQIIRKKQNVSITWYKNGEVLKLADERIKKENNRLVIRRVRRSDAGTYKCVVSLPTIDMQADARLMIKGRMQPWSSWSSCNQPCGGGFKYKRRNCTGIPPNEKTCHGKVEMRRKCNTHVCPGVCSSYGDPHYTTFDGRLFNFQGDCSYILSKDGIGNTFKIIQYNVGCGSRLSCIQKLSIILSMPNLSAVVDLGRDHTALYNGVPIALPFHSASANFSIIQMGLYLMLQVADQLEIRWATPHRLYVVVSGKYEGRTQGLCGNFNGDRHDDRISPQGQVLTSDLEFGQSWAVKDGNANFSCHAVRTINNPCARSETIGSQARDTCRSLNIRSLFGKCHDVIYPGPFIASCMSDICSTSLEKTSLYSCIAMSAYAEECLRRNVVLDWRTEDMCPISCPRGMTYAECGPTCVKYCPEKVEGGKVCLYQRECVSGCFCPADRVFHNGGCIAESECPCEFNGIVFASGASHERNCQQCICRGGGWVCLFNKKHCNYPASVVGSPQSQVAQLGHSVTFCCGVTGTPEPTVEWYFNDVRIAGRERGRIETRKNIANLTLTIANISFHDVGIYTCNASNRLGSHFSRPASLKIFDADENPCRSIPALNKVALPAGCYVTSNGQKETFVNLGKCSGEPCHGSSNRPSFSCTKNRMCCQASSTNLLLVKCRHWAYVTSFFVTVVRECSCVMCSERTTIIEGTVRNALNDGPVYHAMLLYRGRTVGYTTSVGSFKIAIPNLPMNTRHVTITVKDVILKHFATTVRNLVVAPGQSTLHTIYMEPWNAKKVFNTTQGLQCVFRISSGYRRRMKLTIPPNSFVQDQKRNNFSGEVVAGIKFIDHERSLARDRLSLAKNPLALGYKGNELLITPSVWFPKSRCKVNLAPGKFASLSIVTHELGMKLQSWSLDDLTGMWREDRDALVVDSRYTKSGQKVFQARARIRTLNSAWSLASSESPCFLRAKVVGPDGSSIPGIKVSLTRTAFVSGFQKNQNSRRRFKRNRKPLFSSRVEDLTGSPNYPNGVCLPVGCHDTGMLQATRLGNELVLLKPVAPLKSMGRVKEMSVITGNASVFMNISTVLDSSDVINRSNISSYYAYFRTKQACRDTSPSLQTYVFQDSAWIQDQNILSQYGNHSNVILTFGVPSQNRPRNAMKYCHVKVRVRFYPSFTPRRSMQIEVVTYRNNTIQAGNSLLFLGWRTITLEPHPQSDGVVETHYACIEYLCGELLLTDKEQIVLRVTMRERTGINTSQSESSQCRFTPAPPDDLYSTNRATPAHETSVAPMQRWGFLYVHKMFNVRARTYRTARHREILNEFSAATLAESKENCAKTIPEENVSAYFDCF